LSYYDTVRAWLSQSQSLGAQVAVRLLGIAGVLLLARLVMYVGNRAIASAVGRRLRERPAGAGETRRWRTLEALLRNLLYYATGVLALVTVLDLAGIPVQGVLAGVGILGLAVGFGAQNLVRDLLSGFFLLYEDALGVGDYVSVGGYSGTVESVGLRATTLRGDGGELYVVPNGLITDLKNYSRGPQRAFVTVVVGAEHPAGEVQKALEAACRHMQDPDMVEPPTALGMIDFTDLGVKWAVLARTRPMAQWRVERALRLAIKDEFDRAGIRLATLPTTGGSKERRSQDHH